MAKFEGLVPGRHLFYEHPTEGTLAAIVAKVSDADAGRVNVALLLPTGMWINMRDVLPCASVTGEKPYDGFEGFQHHHWRWMFDGQATMAKQLLTPDQAFPGSGEPGAPALEVADGEPKIEAPITTK